MLTEMQSLIRARWFRLKKEFLSNYNSDLFKTAKEFTSVKKVRATTSN